MRGIAGFLVRLALLALVGGWVVYVWPTRFRYDHVSVDGNAYPVRIDRFSGTSDMLVPDQGWVPVEGDDGGGGNQASPTATAN